MKASELLDELDRVDSEGEWLLTTASLREAFPENKRTFDNSISRHVKSGLLSRVAKGLYANGRARSKPENYVLETLVPFLKPEEQNYLSQESVLSILGMTAPIPSNRLTVMTTGRSQTFETPYGTIEFTRTTQSTESILGHAPFDEVRKIRVTGKQQALTDIKRSKRAIELLVDSEPVKAKTFAFLDGFDNDLKRSVLSQLRDIWTHSSTAIEGNTLTLGDTHFILEQGLTVSGKSVKEHDEVIGHASALELIYAMCDRNITEQDLFDLHKTVLTEKITDIYKPYGDWKNEVNGTNIMGPDGKLQYFEYAKPADVPILMTEVIKYINDASVQPMKIDDAALVYAKIHMAIAHTHPFWDGNGRISRLISNIPLLRAGLPPITISADKRREYIETLSQYQFETGRLTSTTGLWPTPNKLTTFIKFCRNSYVEILEVVKSAKNLQENRGVL